MYEIFDEIYRQNKWEGKESVSGPGASLARTAAIRAQLPLLMRELGIKTVLDIPCGDFNWMSHVELERRRYIGADIIPDLVVSNNRRFRRDGCEFRLLDITNDSLPKADLILCRDCLVHFPFDYIDKALANIKRSGARYLLVTTFTGDRENTEAAVGDWRPLNLQLPPFNFPAPYRVINENRTENNGIYSDKSLGLWDIADIPCEACTLGGDSTVRD